MVNNLNELSEIQKALIKYAYFKAKAEMIFSMFPRINSSRDKDDESFRWRYSENNAILSKQELLMKKLVMLAESLEKSKQNKEETNVAKITSELSELEILLNQIKPEAERAIEENNAFEGYQIYFGDLKYDLESIIKNFNYATDEERKEILKYYTNEGNKFGIETKTESPAVFGE